MTMHRALLKKSLHEAKLLWAGCAAWLLVFSWARIWIVSRLEQGRFQAILEQLGEVVSTFSPVPIAHLLSFTGRVAVGYDEPLIVFAVLSFAIARGSDVVSGEFNRGSLEMLLAQPVSRTQILVSQAFVTTMGILLLSCATWAGIWLGVQTTQAKIERQPSVALPLMMKVPLPFLKPKIEKVPMRTQVDPQHFWPAVANLFSLGFCIAGVASLFSAADRYRWRTVGFSMAFVVLQIVINLFGVALKSDALKACSLITAYEPQKLVEIACNRPQYAWTFTYLNDGVWMWGTLAHCAVLLCLGLLSYLLAIVIFVRRDLPAPL